MDLELPSSLSSKEVSYLGIESQLQNSSPRKNRPFAIPRAPLFLVCPTGHTRVKGARASEQALTRSVKIIDFPLAWSFATAFL